MERIIRVFEMDYDKIREQKMAEMKQRAEEQAAAQQKEAEKEMQVEAAVKRLLDEGARTRLTNVKLANRQLYTKAMQAVISFYQSGKVSGKITEAQMKELLATLSAKRETTIRRA